MHGAAEDIVNMNIHILEQNSDAVFNEQGSSQQGGGDSVLSCTLDYSFKCHFKKERVMLCSGLLK